MGKRAWLYLCPHKITYRNNFNSERNCDVDDMENVELKNRQEKLYQRSWNAMRVLKRFEVSDLLRTTGLGFQKEDYLYLMEWIRTLEKHIIIMPIGTSNDESFESKQYFLSRNVGPKRPICCQDCYEFLLPFSLSVLNQIKRDSFWYMTDRCINIYIGATDPELVDNYGFNDHYINIKTYNTWWLGNAGWDYKGHFYAGSEFLRRAINRYDEIMKNELFNPINYLYFE